MSVINGINIIWINHVKTIAQGRKKKLSTNKKETRMCNQHFKGSKIPDHDMNIHHIQ